MVRVTVFGPAKKGEEASSLEGLVSDCPFGALVWALNTWLPPEKEIEGRETVAEAPLASEPVQL
jgi:hypothetical protein